IQPDLTSFRILPYAPKSAIVMGNFYDQYTKEPSPFCTRSLLGKVVHDAVEKHNITFSVGIELEFCLVDSKTEQFVDKSVFANTITLNEQEAFLNDLYNQLQEQYITIELIHAESGPGQIEIVLEYIKNDPVQVVDNVLLAKETIHAVAHKYGLKALFIPKYDFLKAGNGLHVHMSIYDSITGEQIFCNNSSLTQKGSAFVEGILIHMKGLLGLTMPTVNSFRRVGPGCWTGSQIGWDLEDKECGVRVCSNIKTKEWDNVEYKFCDGSCNLYLGLAALLSSGLDGISKAFKLRPSLQTDQPSSSTTADPIPVSLIEALGALEEDNHLIDLIGPRLSKAYLALR
ncbi:glutamine synthetase/guanido kinase, partial [Fragilariopsis cylindrus CCMP1102]